jgi:hypothetical protein
VGVETLELSGVDDDKGQALGGMAWLLGIVVVELAWSGDTHEYHDVAWRWAVP